VLLYTFFISVFLSLFIRSSNNGRNINWQYFIVCESAHVTWDPTWRWRRTCVEVGIYSRFYSGVIELVTSVVVRIHSLITVTRMHINVCALRFEKKYVVNFGKQGFTPAYRTHIGLFQMQ